MWCFKYDIAVNMTEWSIKFCVSLMIVDEKSHLAKNEMLFCK